MTAKSRSKIEQEIFSIDIIKSIFDHPWLFVYPIVIVMSIVIGVLSNTQPLYESSALISLETPVGEIVGERRNFHKENIIKENIISKALVGGNLRNIMSIVFPTINEATDPYRYDALARRVKNRIKIVKRGGDLLTVSCIETNPHRAYKIVRAAVNSIGDAAIQTNVQELKSGTIFLEKQLEVYKEKMSKIDEEILELRTELRMYFPELSAEEQALAKEVSDKGLRDFWQIKTDYAELKIKLARLERQKSELQDQMKKGELYLPSEIATKDEQIKNYMKVIGDREIEINNLISQGYRAAHPKIAALQREIDNLKNLIRGRGKRLGETLSEEEKEAAQAHAKATLEELNWQIDSIKIQLSAVEKGKPEEGLGQQVAEPLSREQLRERMSRLRFLNKEKRVILATYTETRRNLERARLKLRLQGDERTGLGITVMGEPRVPVIPLPKRMFPKFLLGTIVAFSIGVGLSVGTELLDNSVKSASELRELLNVPVMASVGQINTQREADDIKIKRKVAIVGLVVFFVATQIVIKFFR
jgi:hypothetical protein